MPFPFIPLNLPVPPVKDQVPCSSSRLPSFTLAVPWNVENVLSPLSIVATPMPLAAVRVAVTSSDPMTEWSFVFSPPISGPVQAQDSFTSSMACPGRSPTSMLYAGSGLLHCMVPEIFVCALAPTPVNSTTHPAKRVSALMGPPFHNVIRTTALELIFDARVRGN